MVATHLADVAAGLAHAPDRDRRRRAHELDDVLAGLGRHRPRAQGAPRGRARRRRPRGSRVAAPAGHVVGAARTRTWPRSPAVPWAPRCRMPPEMMPEPMPVATLTKTRSSTSARCSRRSPRAMMLTSLSTSTGHRGTRLQAAGDVEAVPAGHDRRVDGAAGGVLDRARAGRCRSRPGRSTGRRWPSSSVAHGRRRPSAARPRGPRRSSMLRADLAQDRAGEVGEGRAGVRGADVDADHHPGGRG